MRLHEDGSVTLQPEEQKYLLATLLHVRSEYVNGRTAGPYREGLSGSIEAGLKLSLFRENGQYVEAGDITQLANEAYAEWRRG